MNTETKLTFSASNMFSLFKSIKLSNKIILASSKNLFSRASLPSFLINSSDKQQGLILANWYRFKYSFSKLYSNAILKLYFV